MGAGVRERVTDRPGVRRMPGTPPVPSTLGNRGDGQAGSASALTTAVEMRSCCPAAVGILPCDAGVVVDPARCGQEATFLRIEPSVDGGIRIEAPPQAARTLMSLFEGMARLMAAAAPPAARHPESNGSPEARTQPRP